jgi:hypothetical protein
MGAELWQTREHVLGLSPYEAGPPPHIRDALEAKRLQWRVQPGEDYPAGYLGTITSRRDPRRDHVLRQNGRSYQRGVHAGSRVDLSYYLWPDEFNLMSGVMTEATGRRFTPPGAGVENLRLVNDGRPGPQDAAVRNGGVPATPVSPDIAVASQKIRDLPPWR